MKIFISHSQYDGNLADQLRQILEASKMKVFIFSKEKLFGEPIDKKIIDELEESDYLVAIITANSQNSSSVNQELGYAQAKSIEKIPMVEVGAEKGFLIHGTENLEFTRDDFYSKCLEIRDYIITQGPKRLFTEEEEDLIKKSAHYRYEVQYFILDFLGSISFRINAIDSRQRHKLFDTEDPDWKKSHALNPLKSFFEKDEHFLIEHFSRIKLSTYSKIQMEYDFLVGKLEEAKRFPNEIMPESECDMKIEFEEYVRDLPPESFDMRKYVENWLSLYPSDTDCTELLKPEDPKFPQLKQNLRHIISDLKELFDILIRILEIHIEYQNKFGNIAFKH